MKFLPFACLMIGAVAGAALAVWFRSEEPDVHASSVHSPAADADEVVRLRKRVAEQEAELARMARRMSASVPVAGRDDAFAEESAAEAERATQREERRRAFQEGRLQRELEAIDGVVGLAPGQREAFEAALRERQATRTAQWEARLRGEPWHNAGPGFEPQVASILTADQLQEFQAYETALSESRLETGATARMNRVAPRLQLSEDQKDAVFAVYHEDLRRWNDADTSVSAPDRATMLVEHMRDILSPEQFVTWEAMEATNGSARGSRRFGF